MSVPRKTRARGVHNKEKLRKLKEKVPAEYSSSLTRAREWIKNNKRFQTNTKEFFSVDFIVPSNN